MSHAQPTCFSPRRWADASSHPQNALVRPQEHGSIATLGCRIAYNNRWRDSAPFSDRSADGITGVRVRPAADRAGQKGWICRWRQEANRDRRACSDASRR